MSEDLEIKSPHREFVVTNKIEAKSLPASVLEDIQKYDADLKLFLDQKNKNLQVLTKAKEKYDTWSLKLITEIKKAIGYKANPADDEEKKKAALKAETEGTKKAADDAKKAEEEETERKRLAAEGKVVDKKQELSDDMKAKEAGLQKLFDSGKPVFDETELKAAGISGWLDLGLGGTHVFGKFQLVSAGWGSDTWKIEKTPGQ